MGSYIRLGLAASLALASVAPLRGQEHEHGGPAPEQLGKVTFATMCNAAVQARFERAVALLHSFWYEEAVQAFTDLVKTDSTCAMGYWGWAMSVWHPLWTPPSPEDLARGLAAAERAVRLTQPGSRERGYAEAVASYYRHYDQTDNRTRMVAYEQAMEKVVAQNPADEEAKAFYALALIAVGYATPQDTTLSRQAKAGQILEPLFQKDPNHPGLAHYLIHAYDFPRFASRAEKAADDYARIAPSVPHAHHMPSHIYTRLGQWDESIVSNLRSADAARRFEEQQHLNALWDQRGHAMDYLEYAYLQEGRDREAKAVVDTAAGVTAIFPPSGLTNDYALAAIPARYALERGQWAEAAKLPLRPAPSWRGTEAITHFARAIGAARSGDLARAAAEVDTLGRLEAALSAAGGPQTQWAVQAKIQRLAAQAWVAHASGQNDEGLRLAQAAADLDDVTDKHPVTPGAVLPARELQADLLLELGRSGEALQAYQATLSRAPGRARSLFGAARAAQLAGDQAAARRWYQQFLQVTSKGDGTRAEVQVAKREVTGR